MKAVYFPTNLCWMVVSSDSLISINGVWSWETSSDLKRALCACNLKLSRNRKIMSA